MTSTTSDLIDSLTEQNKKLTTENKDLREAYERMKKQWEHSTGLLKQVRSIING